MNAGMDSAIEGDARPFGHGARRWDSDAAMVRSAPIICVSMGGVGRVLPTRSASMNLKTNNRDAWTSLLFRVHMAVLA